MKKIILTFMALLVIGSANAQMTKKETGKGPVKERATNLWNKTQETVEKVATKVQEDFTSSNSGLHRIKGNYYMHVYDTNLYQGEEGNAFREMCRKEFKAKYPKVPIQSCVIPQTDWETTPIKEGDQVTGYASTLYCYVLGKDGNEGFINVKFVFEQHKEVGGEFSKSREKWPLWLRTDVVPNDIMEELRTK